MIKTNVTFSESPGTMSEALQIIQNHVIKVEQKLDIEDMVSEIKGWHEMGKWKGFIVSFTFYDDQPDVIIYKWNYVNRAHINPILDMMTVIAKAMIEFSKEMSQAKGARA